MAESVTARSGPPGRVDWDLLRDLAADPGFEPEDYGPLADRKPRGFLGRQTPPLCKGCRARWPGGTVCGVCRNRVKRLREDSSNG